MLSEELKEQIWLLVLEQVNWCREHPSHIACGAAFFDKLEPLIKQAGYVKLSDDQNLPEVPEYFAYNPEHPLDLFDTYEMAQQDMLKSGFRRVEL